MTCRARVDSHEGSWIMCFEWKKVLIFGWESLRKLTVPFHSSIQARSALELGKACPCNSEIPCPVFTPFYPRNEQVYSSSSSSASTVLMAMRSKSRWPDWVMRRPPFSSSCSRTPIFSRDWRTLRSTAPEASTWWLGREPRFLVPPWTLRRRPTPTVLRR